MTRLLDVVSVTLLGLAGAAFAMGMFALREQEDLHAVYWLVVGGVVLKGAVDLLRPGRSG